MGNQYRYPSPIIAERIQQVFWDNGLTDGKVAKAIGQERKSVMMYRQCVSNPTIKFIRYLCNNYDIDVRWLLDLDNKG